MPDEELRQKETPPEEATEKVKKSKRPLLFIIIAAIVFIVGIGAFSVFMGVFSTPSAKTEDARQTTTAEKTTPAEEAADTSISEIELLEQELFAMNDVSDAGDLDELLQLAEERQAGMSEEDSIAAAEWLESETVKLNKRSRELDKREKNLASREYHLKQILAKVSQVESARVNSLAKLYDGMKPEQVAPLINKLTEQQAVQILLKMKPANAAKILGVLSPDRAAAISARMLTLSEE